MSETYLPKQSDYKSSDLREEVEQLRRENAELVDDLAST